MDESNGVVWVPFRASRVELEIASAVLAMMLEREPKKLGAYIGEAYCGVEVLPKRGPKGA